MKLLISKHEKSSEKIHQAMYHMHTKQASKTQSLPQIKVLQQAWQEITIDFIVKLPLSKDTVTDAKYNSILVVVDILTKYTHFISWREKGNTVDLAKIMLKKIICNHGIPQSSISNRNKLFTSKF